MHSFKLIPKYSKYKKIGENCTKIGSGDLRFLVLIKTPKKFLVRWCYKNYKSYLSLISLYHRNITLYIMLVIASTYILGDLKITLNVRNNHWLCMSARIWTFLITIVPRFVIKLLVLQSGRKCQFYIIYTTTFYFRKLFFFVIFVSP